MKVILNSFGVIENKSINKKIQKLSEFEWRTDERLIALIEKRQNEISYLHSLRYNVTPLQQKRRNKLFDDNWFYFKIREVDTTRKWAIADYDGSKYIQYFDVVNEELNFYGFI